MKKIFIILLMLGIRNAYCQTPALWMQQPAISPDGQWIAFEYKQNLYKVSSAGGNAVPLTINNFYNGYPVWSNDGRSIAFASNRYGNFDVYVMSANGGNATRLTFDSAKDLPYEFSSDDQKIYFGTDRHDAPGSVRFPNDNLWMKLYSVPKTGGRSLLVNSAGTEFVHFDQTGTRFIFQDRKGYEDPWRKHHISAVTRDIWTFDMRTGTYTKISDFAGEDREPVWGDDGYCYYLSEREGDQNLFKAKIDKPSAVVKLTSFTKDPVRNLSRSKNGTLAFTQAGRLYTLRDGDKPTILNIIITADHGDDQMQRTPLKDGITEMSVSPSGKEVAFVARGEIYVSAVDGSGTRRITNTPYREAMISFSPDGRTLLYSLEKKGLWDICTAKIGSNNEPYFYAATTINIQNFIATSKNEFQGKFSPDGNFVAYIEERTILRIYDLKKQATVTVLPSGNNYSYADGDQEFAWSPDSRYLITSSSLGHEGNGNAILLDATGQNKNVDLTQSGFNIQHPQWGANGRSIYYLSNKEGLRSLSQGPSQSDVYATFLNKEAFRNFQFTKNELNLQQEIDRMTSDKADKGLKKDDLDLLDPQYSTLKLSLASAEIADVKLSADGEKLYCLTKYESSYDLWVTHPRTRDTRKLAVIGAGNCRMELTGNGKRIFVLADGKIFDIDADNGEKKYLLTAPFIDLDAAGERSEIFEHTYERMLKTFFDPKLQGVQWDYFHDLYGSFLPHINNNYDFQVLLSEFLGELNSSHTGGRFAPSFPDGDETAALGLLYEQTKPNNGLQVNEVLKGGPFDSADSHMRKGCIINRIDSDQLGADIDWAMTLNHKKGKLTLISFHDPKNGTSYQERIIPIGNKDELTLLYRRWVSRMESLTDSLSAGKVGYVHIRAMDEQNYRTTLDRVNGMERDKKALIVDTRLNSGGNLHTLLIKLFSEKTDLIPRPQGHRYIHDGPADGSAKPSCVLMSEGNYSDAFNFPYLYQRMGVGQLIGTPVAGTGTGVFWETQIDRTMVVGFPQLGLSWIGESTLLENHQIDPDILIYNSYKKVLSGRDEQLEAAVAAMLKKIGR